MSTIPAPARVPAPALVLLGLLVLLAVPSLASAQDEPAAPPAGGEAGAVGDTTTDGTATGADGTVGEAVPVDPLFEIQVSVEKMITRSPIAVVDPTNTGGSADASGVQQTIVETVRRDLEMSGLFEVVSESTYGSMVDLKRDGNTATTIDFDGWYLVGASLLVKGTYSVSGGQAEIDLKLFSVDEGTEIKLNWSPTSVSTSRVRPVAHDFVNAIIEHYTGERGVFGTRMLFTGPDTGNLRKVYSVDNAGFDLANYDVPQAVNVLPTWGPDNTVLFTSLTDQGDNLYSYKRADGDLVQLTSDVGYATGADYCASKGLIALTINTEDGTDIYTMKVDGSELTNLTNTPEIIETTPSWGPGCSKMVYVSDESGRPQLYIMGAAGGDVRRLTWVGNYNTTPEWSPKGDLVAFTARDERRRFDIFTINVSDGHITRLTQDQGNNEEPTWSPDGRYLAFQSTRDGRQPRLYLMSQDGRWQTRISDMPGAKTPVWAR